jgi:Rrf2 family protein
MMRGGLGMQISSRFAIAVHILLCIVRFRDAKITSDFLAASVNVNPVVIRRILGQLQKAGLVITKAGSGGSDLAREADKITLFDVFRAVESVSDNVFGFHENPSKKCPVGKNIHGLLDGHMQSAQEQMENSLAKVKLSQLGKELHAIEG